MMSALRCPQTALKLLSAVWRSPRSKFSLIQIQPRSTTDRAGLTWSSISASRYSTVKAKEEKEEANRRQENPDLDPFGLGNVVDSEEGNILIQGFYPGGAAKEAVQPHRPQELLPRPPEVPSRPAATEEIDVEKRARLAEYDSWLQRRQELEPGEMEDSDAVRETHFGKVRMDSDNRPRGQFQPYRDGEEDRRRGRDRDERDYRLPRGSGRSMERERESVMRRARPREEDLGPITETIEAGESVQMRASEFLNQLRGREGMGTEEGDHVPHRHLEKLVIEKTIKPQRGSHDHEQLDDSETVQDDPAALDSHVLPKSYCLPDYNAITEQDMWNILRKCVVFENDFLLALNKPAGVPCHSKAKDCRHFMLNFQKQLADLAKVEKVYPVHRLDKETTGVLLYAKDPKVATVLKKKFKERQVHKVYLAATKLCPTIPEGTIKIPIGEGLIPGTDKKFRQVLRPDLREYGLRPSTKTCVEAITHYKVVNSMKDAAFLEVEPVTGFKHQIRVHLGMGLGCPIIGDHKYAHRDRLAPQRLHPFVLHRLKVKQSKVREIPLHLHCNKISFTLPKEFTDSTEPVYIHANIPYHMKYTLKRLGLIG